MAEIDNSAANSFRKCPYKYKEEYLTDGTGLQPKKNFSDDIDALGYGSRVHELQEERYRLLQGKPIVPYPEADPACEIEAQVMMAAYNAKYPVEEWDEIVDVERTFRAPLPEFCPECFSMDAVLLDAEIRQWECSNCHNIFIGNYHVYTGKIDVVYRKNGELYIMDHKTQNRSSKSNLPEKWSARDQASLYLWVAERIYGERPNRFLVNVMIRQSPKGQEPPTFPERMKLERTQDQINWALRDIWMVANDIEKYKGIFKDGVWPSHKEECCTMSGWKCDFYVPHTYGWSDEIKENKFEPKADYLHLAGVPILQ